jgi:hypothetical protein
MAGLSGMPDRIRIIPNKAVPLCGSFEVRLRATSLMAMHPSPRATDQLFGFRPGDHFLGRGGII